MADHGTCKEDKHTAASVAKLRAANSVAKTTLQPKAKCSRMGGVPGAGLLEPHPAARP